MIERWIRRWQEFWQEFSQDEPGHRFKARYYRREAHERGHIFFRIFNISIGALIAVGSLALSPLPGPGWGTAFIGFAILAGELLPAARFLDWAELKARKFGRFARSVWASSSSVERGMISAAVLAGATAVGSGLYWLFFSV